MAADKFNNKNDLYVRVVKARDLPARDVTGTCDPFVEVKIGNCKYTTHHFENNLNPVWDQVFTLSKDQIQDQILEVIVRDKDVVNDDFLGRVVFDLSEVPSVDGTLASQWYSLEDRRNEKTEGELMLGVWMGFQADVDVAEPNIGPSVYFSPKLWYLRVSVIEAKDLQPTDESRFPEVFVKAILGNQTLKTRVSMIKSINPMWNEDLMFVVSEPFEEPLILSVEDRVSPNKDEVIGRCAIPLKYADVRLDHKPPKSRLYNIQKRVMVEGEKKKGVKCASQIHVRICLEGGYHVLDESTFYSSDLRPAAKQLWKSSIGILELGILSAHGLPPMKTKDEQETTDAYCVAKYGQKWIRTKTIIDSLDPIWNEQYSWEIFDPSTVVTIAIFDNCHFPGGDTSEKDKTIGKVRVRLSTLEKNRIYSHSYPLLVLYPFGVKKMGEIHLTVRFTCSSFINAMRVYSQPMLPKMHYIHPITVIQLDILRHHATQILANRLSQTEPPLRKEVVEYVLDVGSQMWSMRRNKSNTLRMMTILSGVIAFRKWLDDIWKWKNPITTICIHVLLSVLVTHRQHILPTIFLSLFLIIVLHCRWRPQHPFHIDTHLSCADDVHPEELDEELDTFPTSRPADTVRRRYERLRRIGLSYQTIAGDLATYGERISSLTSWRDPRATVIFGVFCLVTSVILYATPFEVVSIITGFYILRHPRLRSKVPSVPMNFFRRLPTRTDSIL